MTRFSFTDLDPCIHTPYYLQKLTYILNKTPTLRLTPSDIIRYIDRRGVEFVKPFVEHMRDNNQSSYFGDPKLIIDVLAALPGVTEVRDEDVVLGMATLLEAYAKEHPDQKFLPEEIATAIKECRYPEIGEVDFWDEGAVEKYTHKLHEERRDGHEFSEEGGDLNNEHWTDDEEIDS